MTGAVTNPEKISGMTLSPGSEILCPHCKKWHPVFQTNSTGTSYTVEMLFFTCKRGNYYAGQLGQTTRFPVRPCDDAP